MDTVLDTWRDPRKELFYTFLDEVSLSALAVTCRALRVEVTAERKRRVNAEGGYARYALWGALPVLKLYERHENDQNERDYELWETHYVIPLCNYLDADVRLDIYLFTNSLRSNHQEARPRDISVYVNTRFDIPSVKEVAMAAIKRGLRVNFQFWSGLQITARTLEDVNAIQTN